MYKYIDKYKVIDINKYIDRELDKYIDKYKVIDEHV